CAPNASHLIKLALLAALGRRADVGLIGTDFPTPDGTGVRDYIHVTDLVEAHALLLQYLRGGGRSATMICGYGRGYSVRQVIDTVKTVSGVDFKVVEQPRRAGDPASVVAKSDRVRQVLGWRPAHDDLEEIVTAAMSWERYLATRNR
ncbi:MAG: NAD-dependent epimerase/dehydratase family protein, partial [Devosia sp.]|nr:NAD-dependent epimerase/dehydratase family protein [Devosia sp.]